jgi:hypothetical protein
MSAEPMTIATVRIAAFKKGIFLSYRQTAAARHVRPAAPE